jgi:hypothetical protein
MHRCEAAHGFPSVDDSRDVDVLRGIRGINVVRQNVSRYFESLTSLFASPNFA